MEKIKVSVIIPVYKSEKYIERCVSSVISQTEKALELILIDDGSPDSSGEICDKLSEKDGRIRVIHTENHGVSHARNIGIAESAGEYITFVDADDWIEKNYVEYLLTLCEKYKTDISTVGYLTDDGEGNTKIIRAFTEKSAKPFEILYPQSEYFQSMVAGKLYKRSLCTLSGFDENTKIGEDRLFWYQTVLRYGKNVAVSSQPLYHYYINANGATNTVDFEKRYNDFTSRLKILELLKNDELLAKLNTSCAVDTAVYCFAMAGNKSDARLSELKNFISQNLKTYLNDDSISLKDKIFGILICHSLPIYRLIRKFRNLIKK